MAFNGNNMTPLGGNARAGNNAQDRNAPMGWAYESKNDSLATIQGVGYFDTFNAFLIAGQFIYVFSADNQKVFLFVDSVDKTLKQVTMNSVPLGPVPVPANVVFVTELASFPDPIADVITLDPNISYELYDLIDTGINTIQIPAATLNRISSTNTGVNNLVFSGTGTFLNGINVLSFVTENSLLQYAGGGAGTLFDIDAGVSNAGSVFSAFRQVYINWDDLGTIKDFSLAALNSVNITNCGPLILDGNERFFITDTVFEPGTDPLTLLTILGANDMMGIIANGEWLIRSGQAALFIDPNIGINSRISIDMIPTDIEAGGIFFETGDTGDIAGIAQNTSNGTINSIVIDPSGILVTTSATHNLEVFQEVDQTTGVTAYDVPTNIISVPSANQYVLPIPFSTGGSGTYIARSVTITTTAPHGQSNGQTLLIEETTEYNGGAKIYLASGSVFNINRNFLGIESQGTFNTGSLTQTDPRITVNQVEGVPDSQIIFNFGVSGGSDETNIAAGNNFQNINFTNATFTTFGTQLFTLVDAITGKFRYEGLEDIAISISGFGSGTKTGLGTLFEFVPAINDNQQSAIIAPSPLTISTNLTSTPFAGVVFMQTGDEIQMQIRNTTSSDNMTIAGYSFIGKV